MKRIALLAGLGVYAASVVNAQEVPRFGFSVGGGFTEAVGNTGRQLDTGWNLQGGGGVNFGPYVGAMIDLGYSSFGINSNVLTGFGVPDGGVHVFSATFDPIVHINPRGHVKLYLTGGGGLYHVYQEFSQPAVATAFNPFFGFYQVGVNQILASNSTNKPGVDGGLGVQFGSKWHGSLFAEARYDRIFMNNNQHMDYVPVTFGFRW